MAPRKVLRAVSAFVEQDDTFQVFLSIFRLAYTVVICLFQATSTPRDVIKFSASLRLPSQG